MTMTWKIYEENFMVSSLSLLSSKVVSSGVNSSKQIGSADYSEVEAAVNSGDSSEELTDKKNKFIEYCSSKAITNAGDFNHYKRVFEHSNGTIADYKFSDYSSDRMRAGSDESKILASTGFKTKIELYAAVSGMISSNLTKLGKELGIDNIHDMLSDADINDLINSSDLNDVAKYYNDCMKPQKSGESDLEFDIRKWDALGEMFDKFSQNTRINSKLKGKAQVMSGLIKDYTNSLKEELEKEIQKAKLVSEQSENEKTIANVESVNNSAASETGGASSAKNIQRYNENLIAASYSVG